MSTIRPGSDNRWARAARGGQEAARLWWHWYASRPHLRGITVSVTGRCDLHCRHCEKGLSDPTRAELSLDTLRHLIDVAGDRRIGLLMTGGEPSLHGDFPAILEHAQRRRVRLELNTNGQALAEADDSLLGLLNETVELLRISLDSSDPAEHDAWRGREGSHDRVLRLLHDPRLTCRREISAVLAVDLHNAAPLLTVARDARCQIVFQPLIFGSNFPGAPGRTWKASQQQDMPSLAAHASAAVLALKREAERLGVRTNLATLQAILGAYYRAAGGPEFYGDTVLPRFRCIIPFQRLTVDEHGRLAPCAFLAGTVRLREGEILQQWTAAAKAWRNAGAAFVREPACRSCSCYFAENERASTALNPRANRRRMMALLSDRARA
jgi:sulfatase maturation enzyme AslB (radical SAM superfamily)